MPAPGAGAGANSTRQQGKQQPTRATGTGSGATAGVPMGAMGGARAAGDEDKEHQRKYKVVALHNVDFVVAPAVIDGEPRDD
jgi:hypothetical protein